MNDRVRPIAPPIFRGLKDEKGDPYKLQASVGPYIDFVIEALRPIYGPGRDDVVRKMLVDWIDGHADQLREMSIPGPTLQVPDLILQAELPETGTDQ